MGKYLIFVIRKRKVTCAFLFLCIKQKNADIIIFVTAKAVIRRVKTVRRRSKMSNKLKEEIASTKGFKEKAKAETAKLKASAIKDKIEKSSVKMSAEKEIKKQPKIQDKKLKTKEKINAL